MHFNSLPHSIVPHVVSSTNDSREPCIIYIGLINFIAPIVFGSVKMQIKNQSRLFINVEIFLQISCLDQQYI